jgi:hypothetical protein
MTKSWNSVEKSLLALRLGIEIFMNIMTKL